MCICIIYIFKTTVMIDNVIKMIYKSTPKIWIGTEFIGKFVINLSDIIMNT